MSPLFRFQNIARSTLHSWKTQKCAFPDCVKWLTEYTQHEPEDPMAAQAPTPLLEKVQIKTHKPREEEEEGEEEDRLQSDTFSCLFIIMNSLEKRIGCMFL